jgi:hypothetical protein
MDLSLLRREASRRRPSVEIVPTKDYDFVDFGTGAGSPVAAARHGSGQPSKE